MVCMGLSREQESITWELAREMLMFIACKYVSKKYTWSGIMRAKIS